MMDIICDFYDVSVHLDYRADVTGVMCRFDVSPHQSFGGCRALAPGLVQVCIFENIHAELFYTTMRKYVISFIDNVSERH